MIDQKRNDPASLKRDVSENVIRFDQFRDVSKNRASASTRPQFDRRRRRDKLIQPTREEIEAKIEASEARTESKIVELRGDMRRVLDRLDTISNGIIAVTNENKSTRSTIIGTGVAVFGALVAVAATAATFWYNGTVVFDHLHPH